MQTTVTAQQIRHFSTYGWIEFDEFLSSDECAAIQAAIEDTVSKRLKGQKITRFSPDQLYLNGRDLWRESSLLKQHYLSQRFAAIAGSLSNKQHLLLACDQWVPDGKTLLPLQMYANVSFQNLACGLVLFLDGEQKGRARFYQPERLPLQSGSQLFIAYGTINSVYVHNANDPLNAYLKQFGYQFGDRIKAQFHPATTFSI